jgi:Ca2+-binding EF-hand superfamily protein
MDGNKNGSRKKREKLEVLTLPSVTLSKNVSLNTSSQNAKDPEAVDKLMKALDHNEDCEVDFDEFVVLITAVVNASGGR